MSSKHVSQKHRILSVRNLQWAVGIALFATITILVLFAGYYYWDRYVGHLGDQSQLELGISTLEGAIRDDPQNLDNRLGLAQLYLSKGMYEEAFDQAEQVLRLRPEDANAMLLAGLSLAWLDRPEEAVEQLENFVTTREGQEMSHVDPLLEKAYFFLGESYYKLERPAEAIAYLEEAHKINRADADILYMLGLAYQANGQPAEAVTQYQAAVRFVPDFTEAYTAMIESYTALGQPDNAAYARGMQAFSVKDYEVAQRELEHVTSAQPDSGAAFVGLGLTYEQLGRLDEAQTAFHRAMELNPDDQSTQQALGRIQATKNRQE